MNDVNNRETAADEPDPRDGSAVNVGSVVQSFYETLPFNQHETVADAARSIRAHALSATYPDLDALLASGQVRTVLEMGCGGGWLANTIAHHYGASVTAVDFCNSALERARDVSRSLGTNSAIRFVASDIFDYEQDGTVDLVVSMGALHHTRDCQAAFQHAQSFAGPGGAVHVGLYHEPGRRPFLSMFRELVETEGEDAALARYRALDGIHARDETLLRSWFRDQVLHPHETQHTLREVVAWLRDADLELRSTSINRFAPLECLDALYEREQELAERSRRANCDEGRYFPGFFTVLATRSAFSSATS